jgi:hypothetical protein
VSPLSQGIGGGVAAETEALVSIRPARARGTATERLSVAEHSDDADVGGRRFVHCNHGAPIPTLFGDMPTSWKATLGGGRRFRPRQPQFNQDLLQILVELCQPLDNPFSEGDKGARKWL